MALKLLNVTMEDLNLIAQWRMKSEVTKYMYTDPVLDMNTQLKWFNNIKNDDKVRYWIIEFDGVKIGVISLTDIDNKNKRCSWAYYIGDTSFRGRGIATLLECNIYDYVFNLLKLNKLCCEVFTFNERVIEIHKKFGSEVEGILKEHICKDNNFYDIVTMAITKSKWINIKNNYVYDKIFIEQ